MVYSWRKISVWIGKEATRGTAVAPSMYYAHTNFQPQDKVEYVEDSSVMGVMAKVYDKDTTNKYAELPIWGYVGTESIGYFLFALFGQSTSAEIAPSSGVYTHDFSLNNNNIHPTFTLVEKNGVEGLAYPLSAIQSLKVNFSQWEYVWLDSTWLSRISETMSLTPTYTDEKKFKSRQVEIFEAENLAGLDSAASICVESWSLEFSKEIEQLFCLWDIAPKEVVFKVFDVVGSLTIKHTNNTFSNYQKNGTKRALRIKITDTDTSIGGTYNSSIIFDLPKVSFTDVIKEWGADDVIRQNISISGLYDLTSNTSVNCKLTNITNTY